MTPSNLRPARVLRLLTLLLALSATLLLRPQDALAQGVITPNDDVLREGLNFAVWQESTGGATPASTVALTVDGQLEARGLSLSVLWMYTSGQWQYFIADFQGASTLQSVPPRR